MPENSVAQALAAARRGGVDRLDAQLLLASVLGRPRGWLLAHDDGLLDFDQVATWQQLLARRAAGEPLAYLLGWKEFFGLPLQVDASVLVPRPDTETLVTWAIEHLQNWPRGAGAQRVLDLGTGSGAIALALKHTHPSADLTATDASAAALAVAAGNGERLGLAVAWRLGHWWSALGADASFDLIVSNPPYVAEGDAHLPALRHEPLSALTSGPDGLDDLREIVSGAKDRLEPGGWLLLEHGWDQAEQVCGLLSAAGFACIGSRADLSGQVRCSGGRRPL